MIRSLPFIAQVDLIWKHLKKQHGVCAAAELNKMLRYIVSLLGDPAALNASCPAMLKCPHMPSVAHRDKYGCDLGTGEEEQGHPMLE